MPRFHQQGEGTVHGFDEKISRYSRKKKSREQTEQKTRFRTRDGIGNLAPGLVGVRFVRFHLRLNRNL